MNKILSIIVPSYNMEAYLPKCLGSLIIDNKELLQKLDVVVVNDGSKDRTSDIAHEFEFNYPGIFRVIDKSNGNYGSCINAALKVVSGIFVKILDADDSYDTDAFEKLLGVMVRSEAQSEGVDLFLADYVEVGPDGREIRLRPIRFPVGGAIDMCTVEHLPLLYMHAVAYRTENLIKLGYVQTEGISYTDNEWVYYPISTVRKVRYEHFTVYKYLVGRIGQTISPDALKKSTWVTALIAMRMAKEFPLLTHDVAHVIREYLEDFVTMMCMRVYNGVIINLHNKADDQKLLEFDNELKTISDVIYKQVMERLVSRKIEFYYGRYWSRYKTSNMLKLRMFRLYMLFVSACTMVSRCIRVAR